MSRESSQEEALFDQMVAQPPGDRLAFLEQACPGNVQLRDRLRRLLMAHLCSQSMLQPPGEATREMVGERPGDTIGRYKLLQPLGEGGCGVVYMADQEEPVRRRVALKVIKAGMDTREVIARFAAERQALALMEHPHIAQVFDAGTTAGGRPYFVMELVRGIPLTKFCDEQALSIEARLSLFIKICDAVQHAHHKGIVHRDLKASNILVTLASGEPVPKIIDFGIAKAMQGRLTSDTVVTVYEQFIGTPAYMSPEQAEMSPLDVDTRTDVYSLGVLLYELLVGHMPFDPKTLGQASREEVRRIIREVEPPAPSRRLGSLDQSERARLASRRACEPGRLAATLAGDLDWIAMKAMEKNRARRYETPAALAADITRHLRHELVVARPPSPLYRTSKFIRRHRVGFTAAAALALTLVLGTAASVWQAVRARAAERRANVERARAEELLEFMVGDLRRQLAKVGRLDVLEAVGDKAMGYFAALNPDELTPGGLARHARTLTQIGEIRLHQARYAEALESFRAAYRRAAAAAEREPGNGDLIFERGQAEFWIGCVHQKRRELQPAGEWLGRYRDTGVALARLDPLRPAWQRELAYGQHNMAVLQKERGEFVDARRGFLAALATWQRLHAGDRTDDEIRSQIADTHSWLGSVAEESGDFAEAAVRFAEHVRRIEELTSMDPGNTRWRHELADGILFQADIMIVSGQPAAAAERLEIARGIMQELVRRDSANVRWLATSLNVGLRLARLAAHAGDYRAATTLVDEIRPQLERLAAAEPTEPGFATLLAGVWRLEAQLRLAADRGDAADAAARAVEISERLVRGGSDVVATCGESAQSFLVAAVIAARRGDVVEAQRWFGRATEVLAPHAGKTRDWRLLDPVLRLAMLTRRPDGAAGVAAQLKELGYVPLVPWPDADRRGVVTN